MQFESFQQFQAALDDLKCTGLCVYNSQTVEDYNKKRQTKKIVTDLVDVEKGIKPNQLNFSLGCKAKIIPSYDRYSMHGLKCHIEIHFFVLQVL